MLKKAQKLDLTDQDIKTGIRNMHKELKETIFNELKKGMKMMCHQTISKRDRDD